MIKRKIKEAIKKRLSEKYDSVPEFIVSTPPKNIKADFAVNLPLLYAKLLNKSPDSAAEELIEILKGVSISAVLIFKDLANNGGFLNILLADEFISGNLKEIFTEGEKAYRENENENKKILIEFVSSNPTGPLHIGHARCAAIGDSLAILFSKFGYQVDKEYYVNDAGNQVNLLEKSVNARISEISGEKTEFPADGYKGEYIKEIAARALEKKISDVKKYAVEFIMDGTKKDLSEFRVEIDNYFYESSITTAVDDVMSELKNNKKIYERDGALWFKAEENRNDADQDRVLKKKDGGYTYFATDVAYHKNKYERGYARLINVWGADHHGYVARVKSAVKALGFNPDLLTIILYQLVALKRSGKKIAMSTRAGEFVTMKEVVDEVGADAARFFLLMRSPNSSIDFDIDLAKKRSSENPVYYVQYAHARISSVFAQAELIGIKRNASDEFPKFDIQAERELAKAISSFGDVLEISKKELSTHHITAYLIDLAKKLHNFYENCRVISEDKDLTCARLNLLFCAKKTIELGLNILGVSAPEKM